MKIFKFKFKQWDTAGQERYNNLAPMYYRNSEGIIIVFDLTFQVIFFEKI